MRCVNEQTMVIIICLQGVIQFRAPFGRRGGVSGGDDISFPFIIISKKLYLISFHILQEMFKMERKVYASNRLSCR